LIGAAKLTLYPTNIYYILISIITSSLLHTNIWYPIISTVNINSMNSKKAQSILAIVLLVHFEKKAIVLLVAATNQHES
jgi:hypothetical protein